MTEKRHVFGSVFNHVLLLRFRFRFFTIRWRNEEEKSWKSFIINRSPLDSKQFLLTEMCYSPKHRIYALESICKKSSAIKDKQHLICRKFIIR